LSKRFASAGTFNPYGGFLLSALKDALQDVSVEDRKEVHWLKTVMESDIKPEGQDPRIDSRRQGLEECQHGGKGNQPGSEGMGCTTSTLEPSRRPTG
jgi:hypothetical protein